ncbi:LPS assembly lipoprotein LptE [Neptuniibacter sp.]|uniref:LPS-assembly lipoprotein LptE n=1 Tax=Neptuniibacter sp. TaxID=1962643 RepID=UPI00260CFD47|nr:LPS assembly lipoprotein LptE [Neptuniibacter sp.]MCP4598461.1 hypothetical protein [Neptuniibacter sp.]
MITQWKASLAKVVLVIGLFSLISACGFHLRGAQNVDDSLRQVTLTGNNISSELLHSIRQNMKFNGIEETAGAPYQIQILQNRYKRRAATLSSNSDVDEYELSLEVSMLVADQQGTPLTSDINIQHERIYDYDKNAAAASSEQESLLRRELHDSVAQTIIRRYLAVKPKQ